MLAARLNIHFYFLIMIVYAVWSVTLKGKTYLERVKKIASCIIFKSTFEIVRVVSRVSTDREIRRRDTTRGVAG